ncbi:hypothetical protein HPP92_023219 [Vanilla planifolia]|uniref:Uncharacterized protein n=1 Tax=Vanilla planifolia TaxID=51239 RepID=A0A835UDX7_VANPL|nr:hypothetical protein HPP92_023219 [Vanilla planifolia]
MKQFEKDYESLRREFDALESQNDTLRAQDGRLQAELLAWRDRTEENLDFSKLWFLDSSCSNHMTGFKHLFNQLDEIHKLNVKLGDDKNLLSIGQLIECGYSVTFEEKKCTITDNATQQIMAIVEMATNKQFSLEISRVEEKTSITCDNDGGRETDGSDTADVYSSVAVSLVLEVGLQTKADVG